jgi:transcriptional regulator with XRE-family HTH domain
VDQDVTYSTVSSSSQPLDLVDLRRALGALTQAEAAQLLGVAANTWARWERGNLQLHPARAQQLHRLHHLLSQYGEGPFWGLGIDGIRGVLDGQSVPEALQAHGLDPHGAPLRHYLDNSNPSAAIDPTPGSSSIGPGEEVRPDND